MNKAITWFVDIIMFLEGVMNQIKVNIANLRTSAQDLSVSTNDIITIAAQFPKNDIANDYNGQLKNAVAGMTINAHPRAVQFQNGSRELRDELVLKADRFEAANGSVGSTVINVSHQLNDFIDRLRLRKLFGSISKLDLAKVSLFWEVSIFSPVINRSVQK